MDFIRKCVLAARAIKRAATALFCRNHAFRFHCKICLNNKPKRKMFKARICPHSFCNDCIARHVDAQLQIGRLPTCPHPRCTLPLDLANCKPFLPRKLFRLFRTRLEEESIPFSDKVYCPYPDCSVLMQLQKPISPSLPSTFCLKCKRPFCIKCRVPWHYNVLCKDYENEEDRPLHHVANDKGWSQCPRCRQMIEHTGGCYYVVCRYLCALPDSVFFFRDEAFQVLIFFCICRCGFGFEFLNSDKK